MERIEKYFEELARTMTDWEIVAALGNGELERPEWLSVAEGTNYAKAWDSENGGSAQMGFVYLSYSNIDGGN